MSRGALSVLVLLILIGTVPARASDTSAPAPLQSVVDELRGALGLGPVVRVVLVDENPHVVSVGRDPEAPHSFVLAIERAFLAELTGSEVRAVVAHELGHVWIYGHHPYLQTEHLANQIALRVVERDELDSVYVKLETVSGRRIAQHLR